ncbi:hypothetical protein WG29040_04680 [Pseudomonas sp. PAMC 29040]|nr:hypothetical protein WG29040_04680 [Pseudomonas sp. PAMC 29040]
MKPCASAASRPRLLRRRSKQHATSLWEPACRRWHQRGLSDPSRCNHRQQAGSHSRLWWVKVWIVQIITNCLAPLLSLLYNCAPCRHGGRICASLGKTHKCHSLLV